MRIVELATVLIALPVMLSCFLGDITGPQERAEREARALAAQRKNSEMFFKSLLLAKANRKKVESKSNVILEVDR